LLPLPLPPVEFSDLPLGAVPDDPLVSVDFSSWFSKVFAGMRRSWKSLLIFQLLVLVTSSILALALRAANSQFVQTSSNGRKSIRGVVVVALVSYVCAFAIRAVPEVASAHVIAHDAASHTQGDSSRTGWRQGLRFGFSRSVPMIGWSIATSLLTIVGSVFCLLPGIYLAVAFWGTLTGVVAFERPPSVVGRCLELMKGHWWQVVARALLVAVARLAVGHVVSLLTGGFSPAARRARANGIGSTIVSNVLNVPFGMFVSIATIITYAELRRKLEPITSAQLAAESALPT
jgi:hypothetical protein